MKELCQQLEGSICADEKLNYILWILQSVI